MINLSKAQCLGCFWRLDRWDSLSTREFYCTTCDPNGVREQRARRTERYKQTQKELEQRVRVARSVRAARADTYQDVLVRLDLAVQELRMAARLLGLSGRVEEQRRADSLRKSISVLAAALPRGAP